MMKKQSLIESKHFGDHKIVVIVKITAYRNIWSMIGLICASNCIE